MNGSHSCKSFASYAAALLLSLVLATLLSAPAYASEVQATLTDDDAAQVSTGAAGLAATTEPTAAVEPVEATETAETAGSVEADGAVSTQADAGGAAESGVAASDTAEDVAVPQSAAEGQTDSAPTDDAVSATESAASEPTPTAGSSSSNITAASGGAPVASAGASSAARAVGTVAVASAAAPARRVLASQGASDQGAGTTVTVGGFAVTGDASAYSYDDGVLTITGDVKVANAETDTTSDRIVIANNATLTLAGVNIEAADGPAIKVAAGVVATIQLVANITNTVIGGSGYAGVDVGYEKDKLATLVIDGEGTLVATGGANSAGIGGSFNNKNAAGNGTASYSGNITIKGGTIEATGTSGGAGIGSGSNNGRNADGNTTGKSASYPMGYDEIGTIAIAGGTVTATGDGGAAGIGGGSHADGLVVIDGGTITATGNGGGAGIGCGIGSQKREGDGTKGPGSYCAWVTVNGGDIVAKSTWLGAGVGGGYGCDAIVAINGGTINAVGGNGSGDANYQGGPGVGAGYMGLAVVTIDGGTVDATGGTGAPGIGNGAGALAQHEGESFDNKKRGDGAIVSYDDAITVINGGTVTARGGINAAGIGTGNGNEVCHVVITGGTVTAYGYSDPENLTVGGAGIGSGTGLNGGATKYKSDTDDYIVITGGTVVAVGGWGASGIGSGAENKQAIAITIDASKANVEAYSDGTKFAIDTRVVDEDGSTSTAGNTSVIGNIIQGTFVHAGTIGDYSQNPEGLSSITLTNETTGETKVLVNMPEGYRGYAATVASPGVFTVYTDDEGIGHGEGRYFARCETDVWDAANAEHNAQYVVVSDTLSDNFYLFPVKTVVVRKVVDAPEELLSQINETFYFALWIAPENRYLTRADGSIWVESIDVVGGIAQNIAMFVGVDDMTFGVWEVANAQGDDLPNVAENPVDYGAYRLVAITTTHGETDDNDATLGAGVWTDSVTVINTFAATSDPVDPEEPEDPEDPENPVDPEGPEDPADLEDPENAIEPEGVDEPEVVSTEPIAPADSLNPGTATNVVATLAAPAAPAATPAAPAATIADDSTPLANPEAIEDEGNPLAGHGMHCWVHWWILLGILLTAAYSAVVLARRQRNSNNLSKMDRDTLNGAHRTGARPQPASAPRLQPNTTA